MSLDERRDLTELLERKHLHDTALLGSQIVIVGGIVLASRTTALDIDLRFIVIGFVVHTALYTLAGEACRKVRSYARLAGLVRILHLSTVVFLAFVWWQLGGPGFPLFLMAFTLPIVSAGILLLPGHGLLTAIVSLTLVSAVSMAGDLGLGGAHGQRLGAQAFGSAGSSPAIVAAFFGMALVALAITTGATTDLARRLRRQISDLSQTLKNVRTLYHTVFQATPVPETLVQAESGAIVQASDAFVERFGQAPPGARLFDLVELDRADEIRSAIERGRASQILTAIHAEGEKRVSNVVTYPIEYEGQSYAHVSVHDESHIYLHVAVESLDGALFVVDPEDRIAYFNPRAAVLFGELQRGASIGSILSRLGLPRLFLKLVQHGRWQVEAELDDANYTVAASVFEATGLGRLKILVVRREPTGGTSEILNPLQTFQAPRFFTESVSRFLRGADPSGSFGIVKLTYQGDDPLERHDFELSLLRAIEAELRDVDVFLGLRAGEFGLLAPGQDAAEAARVLKRGESAVLGASVEGEAKPVQISSSIVTIASGDDLDGLMRRATKGLQPVEQAAP